MRINLDEYKIFEIKCNEIPITALPAGAKAPEYETEFERIDPSPLDFSQGKMENYRNKIAAVMVPADLDELTRIEQ